MAKITIIDLKNFPTDKTIFYLLQEKSERNKRINAEISGWSKTFPSVKSKIWVLLPNSFDDKQFLSEFNSKFNKENDILNPAKTDTKNQLKELLTEKEGDSEIIKLLKEVANGQETDLERGINEWKAGVIGLSFLIKSIEGFYLTDLPEYIKDKLETTEAVKLEEVDQEKLKGFVGEIFATLYAGFSSLDSQDKLDEFQQGISEPVEEIKKLVGEARNSKKPTEDIKAIKEELEDNKKKLDEWEKLFDYLGITVAKQDLKDLKEASKVLSKWMLTFKDYPNGAEDVLKTIDLLKETVNFLEPLAKDLFRKIREYDQNPDLLYEVPPTPPNTPDTMKPVKDDGDIPPIKN